jgi:hypothetical protein
VSVGLKETDWDPKDGDGIDLYPGYSAYKNPTIKNTAMQGDGGGSVYCRMIVSIRDQKGELIPDQKVLALIKETIRYDETYTGTYETKGSGTRIVQGQSYSQEMLKALPMVNPVFLPDPDRSTENVLVFNYMGIDGNGLLQSGEESALFTAVVIPSDWGFEELEQVGDFVLDIAQESIQSSGFESQAAAFLALDETEREGGRDS